MGLYGSEAYVALGYIEGAAREIVELSSIKTGSRADYQERMRRIEEISRKVEAKAREA
jgi:hypothetical protein